MNGPASVILDRLGTCAMASLNRPKVLNAVNKRMIDHLAGAFKDWTSVNSDVCCIIIRGLGDKAFCAGGDVKEVVQQGLAGNFAAPEDFFRAEYRLNYHISELNKPYIALIDGITMGGGCGLAMHGPFRVATERTLVAMPECAIGLFPDVGATRFLNLLQDGLGKYLAITGARLTGSEVKVAGLATHYIPSSMISMVPERVASLGQEAIDLSLVNNVLLDMEEPIPTDVMDDARRKLNFLSSCFVHDDIDEIVSHLQSHNGDYKEYCQAAIKAIQTGSPMSIKMTMEALERGKNQDLRNCLEREFNMARFCSHGKADFFEGVRAMLMDKDKNPIWKYKSLSEVPDSALYECFSEGSKILAPTQPLTKL